ncbi:LOW QUALITY PROTEIN: zinc finger SWIM domain-containing protein 3 [Egretta garzetta]|uniref:LOW QUALITY PROTEIN: zinc finger SWIM domain-containing protein 3 n=1 Tax=Egretta garzetta TaxID=188379 RepID=UPI00163C5148|nr:LOW QUALITY PROTEIN: zinc finger SWIM domain-containing protein 3 [Egretta garzetta]
MQVKFGCARTQKYSKRRTQQPSLCPAYFVLQYQDVDLLVISELNSNHVHADPMFSLTRATGQAGGSDSAAVAGEDSHTVTEQPVGRAPALCRAPPLPEALTENASALIRVAEVVKTFPRVDRGSLASISTVGDRGLDRLSSQTVRLKSSFMQFSESLLLHRAPSAGGGVLYAFLVEGKEQAGRVVHLSLLKDDTGHSVRRILSAFKEFNPEWQKVQAVFVDMSFSHKAILQAPPLPEALTENASALIRVAEVVKTFPRVDRGSLASISTDGDRGLDRLSSQTVRLKSSFMQFSESLLLHRAPSAGGGVLYAFLVEGKEQAGRVVHLSLLKDDTGHSVRRILSAFKEFNPEWQKGQAVFTVQLLGNAVKKAEISSSFKQNLVLALQKAVFSPSAASLDALSQLAKHMVSPELYDYLRANWLSCEPLWCLHMEKDPHSCSTHMDSLDLITHQIPGLFGQQLSLEASVLCFLEHVDCLDSRGLESLNRGSWGTEEDGQSSLQEKPDAPAGAAAEPGPVPEVLSRQRQKGCDARQAGRDSADGLLEVLKSSWNESLDNSLVVSFLMAEISRLLPHCGREEFERRYRTLRELADSRIGPCVEVKL